MSKIKIRVSDVSRIYNVGIAIIMLVPCMLYSVLGKRNIIKGTAMLIPIIAYLWYNDYSTSETLHILINGNQAVEGAKVIVNIGKNVL